MAAFLITGRPGTGKTTLVRSVVEALDVPAGGFYTRERRHKRGFRTGFDLVTLAGESKTLAATDFESPHRVGKYGVNVDAVDHLGVPAIVAAVEAGALVVIDEIGRMELLSTTFQRAVVEAIRRSSLILGTIMLGAHPFADELKAQRDSFVYEITESNRDEVRGQVEAQLRAATGQFTV